MPARSAFIVSILHQYTQEIISSILFVNNTLCEGFQLFQFYSQTDGIFQDGTIGNIKINFVITRLVLITNAEVLLNILNSFSITANYTQSCGKILKTFFLSIRVCYAFAVNKSVADYCSYQNCSEPSSPVPDNCG